MSLIGRRTFLAGAALAPAVYGLRELLGQQDAAVEPDWWPKALDRMKQTGRWGLVIVAPASEPARRSIGYGIYALTEVEDEDVEAHDLLLQTVTMAMTAEIARKKFPKMPDGANRILLDPDGTPVAWDQVALGVYETGAGFVASFRPFVHGADNARLIEWAGAVEKGLPEELRKAADRLGSESADERIAAAVVLTRSAESMTPYLASLSLLGRNEDQKRQARLLLRRHFASLPRETVGSTLPYGCYLRRFVGSCSVSVPVEEHSISCGMGRVSKRSRKFVSFLVG